MAKNIPARISRSVLSGMGPNYESFEDAINQSASNSFISAAKAADIWPEKNFLKEMRAAEAAVEVSFPNSSSIDYGSYLSDELVSFFFDIRGSTPLIFELGAEALFSINLTLFPVLSNVIESTGGFVVDYPGDGIMAIWGLEEKGSPKQDMRYYVWQAIEAAELVRLSMEVINNRVFDYYPLLFKTGTNREKIQPVAFSIGIASGSVCLTKLGVPGRNFVQDKAIGPSVNLAAKLAQMDGSSVLLSYNSMRLFPDAQTGKATFTYGRPIYNGMAVPISDVKVEQRSVVAVVKALNS